MVKHLLRILALTVLTVAFSVRVPTATAQGWNCGPCDGGECIFLWYSLCEEFDESCVEFPDLDCR
jgi:hypothetical protein